jgi:hypothetical protein
MKQYKLNKIVLNLKNLKKNILFFRFYKSFFSDLRFNLFFRFFFFKKIINKDFLLTKTSLICKKSSRTTGVINGFFEFRMFFKLKNFFGMYSGIRKSSW